MRRGCPCRPCPALEQPHTHSIGTTYAILRLWALLKPAKEALRPTTPTAPVSLEDRNRTLTDMAVTYRERTGESASHGHLVSTNHRLATLHHGLQGPYNSHRDRWLGLSPDPRWQNSVSEGLGNLLGRSGRSTIGTQVSALGAGALYA